VHARLRLTLIAVTVCAVAAVIGISLAANGNGGGSGPLLQNGWAGALRPSGLRVPEFTLRDQAGQVVTSDSLRGKPTIFAFVYTTCRDTCPAQVQDIRQALNNTGVHMNVIGITVDPKTDTPKLAKTFLINQTMYGRMRLLLGTQAQLAPIWKAFGIQPETKALEHSAEIVLADANGFQRIGFPFDHLTPEGLGHDMRKLAQP
jgi:protein SCO1/2